MELSRSGRMGIENEGFKALKEYIASCTVIITSETRGFEHGSGVAVRYSNQDYIFTAAHVLEQELDNKKIMVIGRCDATLIEVDKDHLAEAAFTGSHGRPAFAAATQINIKERILGNGNDDIAALKIQNTKEFLPHTISHNISTQGETKISVGETVNICGFPGELAQQVEHRVTKQRGAAAFLHLEQREIKQISDAPCKLDPKIHFVTDFTFDDNTCDPKGMSGSGIWSIPKLKKDKIWTPYESQLLGIQSTFYPTSKLLKVVRIERILHLL